MTRPDNARHKGVQLASPQDKNIVAQNHATSVYLPQKYANKLRCKRGQVLVMRLRSSFILSCTEERLPRYGLRLLPLIYRNTPLPTSLHSMLSSIRKKVRTRCRSPPHKWLFAGCSSSFMRLAENT